MALITDGHLNKSIPLINLLEFGRDYCSDHLGRFFQNKYSPPAQAVNKFVIPAKFITKNEQISAKTNFIEMELVVLFNIC